MILYRALSLPRHVTDEAKGLESPAIEADLSVIKDMYNVNVFGPMEMVQQFTPLLLQAKGTIVNVGSAPGPPPTNHLVVCSPSC